jgi:hypothetical protein
MVAMTAKVSIAVFVCLLCSCTRRDEQAVRHVVTAELMQRYKISDGELRILEVRLDERESTVYAAFREQGRAGIKRELICRVRRSVSPSSSEARWTVTTIDERRAAP